MERGGCLATGAALMASLLLVGCTLLQPVPDGGVPIDELDTEPIHGAAELGQGPVVGPVVEIARGRVAGNEFRLTVHQTPDGLCTEMVYGNGGGGSCGPRPGGVLGENFGMVSSGAQIGIPAEVSGIVSADVASIRIELSEGPPARAILLSLEPLELDDQVFLAFLPVGSIPAAIVAVGEDGSILERFALDAPARPGVVAPAPVVTPAAP